MKIITIPHKVLLSKTKPVKEFGAKLKKIVLEMREALEACVDPVGVGLAAPQVGLALRIFLMKPTPKSTTQIFINPTLLSVDSKYKSQETPSGPDKESQAQAEDSLEGCLSIPKIWGPVSRAHKVTLVWYDVTGKKHEKDFMDFEAIIIQHEMDHLEGVLFTHRSAEQHAPLYEEENKKLYEMKI